MSNNNTVINSTSNNGLVPNYVINLDELAQALVDGLKSNKLVNSGEKKVKGLQLNIEKYGINSLQWVPSSDIYITEIKFNPQNIRNIGYHNSWTVMVDSQKIIEDVYVKEMNERKRFRSPLFLKKGKPITIYYNNIDNCLPKAFFDIEYIKEIEVVNVEILCIDNKTNKIIANFMNYYTLPTTATIMPPNLQNYTPLSDKIILYLQKNINKPINLQFYYSKNIGIE